MRRSLLQLILYAYLGLKLVLASPSDNPESEGLPARYFPLQIHSSHLDPRYAGRRKIPDVERHTALVQLIQCLLNTMEGLKVDAWLAHGTLLGWHWGRHILPWDEHIDIHIQYHDLLFLAAYYNMTVHPEGSGSRYLLEVNPNHVWRSGRRDPMNWIDARFIDMETGIYADITGVDEIRPQFGDDESYLVAKDENKYEKGAVFPLRLSVFEDVQASVPADALRILELEFGAEALENRTQYGQEFDVESKTWVPLNPVPWGISLRL